MGAQHKSAARANHDESLDLDIILLDQIKGGEGLRLKNSGPANHYTCHFSAKPRTVKTDNFCDRVAAGCNCCNILLLIGDGIRKEELQPEPRMKVSFPRCWS